MNKILLITIIGIAIQACSFLPTNELVYRSTRDINLQPQDVPDLTEAAVDNPPNGPLLPEAVEQNQRVYVNAFQQIYIESNVIMVPKRT